MHSIRFLSENRKDVPLIGPGTALTLWALLLPVMGCLTPSIIHEEQLVDGVSHSGSDICCPTEIHPGDPVLLNAFDRDRYSPRMVCPEDGKLSFLDWRTEPDCDGRESRLRRLIGRRRSFHCLPVFPRQVALDSPVTPQMEQATIENALLFLALENKQTISGLSLSPEDIVAFDGSAFAKIMDGSDVGLRGLDLDAIGYLGNGRFLLSFKDEFDVGRKHPLPGITGHVDDSDILVFEANSLGEITRGSFSRYLNGKEAGLKEDAHDIDALTALNERELVVSFVGQCRVGEQSFQDEDLALLRLDRTTGAWTIVSRLVDSSKFGIGDDDGEDISGVSIDGNRVYVSTRDKPIVAGTRHEPGDILQFPILNGKKTGRLPEGFRPGILFRPSDFQIRGNLAGFVVYPYNRRN